MTTATTLTLISPGPDFYTYIHKSFRSRLFDAAVRAGRTDWTNQVESQITRSLIIQLFSDLRDHAEHETQFWHPLIARVNPDALRELEAEHALQEHQIAEMSRVLEVSSSGDVEAGKEFYRAFNAFIGEFLLHLAEEEQGNPLLWSAYKDGELAEALHAFKITLALEESLRYLEAMLPVMTPQERAAFFAELAGAPKVLVASIRDVATRVLGPDAWPWPDEAQ